MAQIIWTEPALTDLDTIAEYIALDKPAAARKLVKSVFKRVGLLEEAPNSGRMPPELTNSRYREVIVGPCRVFYRYTDNTLFLLHVMRSERELRLYVLNEREAENS